MSRLSELPFLDHGVVRVRDVMGSDLTVVNAARVSFDTKSEWEHITWDMHDPDPFGAQNVVGHGHGDWCEGNVLSKKDARLIDFLAEGGHWSPFAHPQISLELYLPGMVLDQLVKHRIGMVYSDEESFVAYENAADNQMSMRYKEPIDFYIPTVWRSAPENKKQGSGEPIHDWGCEIMTAHMKDVVRECTKRYREAINNNVAPEQARLLLPYYAMYTRRYWTSSLMGIIRFLQLREKPDAQYEIRDLAHAVHRLIEPRFPYSFRAYGLGEVDSSDTGGTSGE